MVYSDAQKLSIYRWRAKARETPHYKEKIRAYNQTNYENVMADPDRHEQHLARARWHRYYAAEPLCDVRRLFRG